MACLFFRFTCLNFVHIFLVLREESLRDRLTCRGSELLRAGLECCLPLLLPRSRCHSLSWGTVNSRQLQGGRRCSIT